MNLSTGTSVWYKTSVAALHILIPILLLFSPTETFLEFPKNLKSQKRKTLWFQTFESLHAWVENAFQLAETPTRACFLSSLLSHSSQSSSLLSAIILFFPCNKQHSSARFRKWVSGQRVFSVFPN